MPKLKDSEKDKEKREIGDNLRMKRESAGMSQSQLADKLGVERNVVHRYEAGENAMSLPTAAKIASILHISVDELVPAEYRWVEEPENQSSEKIESIDPRMDVLLERINTLSPEKLDMFYMMADVAIKGLSSDCKTA